MKLLNGLIAVSIMAALLCRRQSHTYGIEYTSELMTFRIWGKCLSLNRFHLIQGTYILQTQTCQFKSPQVCYGYAPNHIRFDRLIPNPINQFHSYNLESLIQAVFAQYISYFSCITYISNLQPKSLEWLQLHRFQ